MEPARKEESMLHGRQIPWYGGETFGSIRDGFGPGFLSPKSPMISPEKMPKINLKTIYNKEAHAHNGSTSHVLEGWIPTGDSPEAKGRTCILSALAWSLAWGTYRKTKYKKYFRAGRGSQTAVPQPAGIRGILTVCRPNVTVSNTVWTDCSWKDLIRTAWQDLLQAGICANAVLHQGHYSDDKWCF